jgi:xanthine/CO dehydrogenase XdhC/CoxF family maturation factor
VKELGEILAAICRADSAGEGAALATIISVRGSTYRREGARLLTTSSGRQTGNISGGCLEGDLAVVSSEVLASGVPRVVTYDLTADDDTVWGLGLGCAGAIEVFVEPISAGDPLWRAVEVALEHEDTVSVATVVGGAGDVPAGRRVLVWPGGRREGSLGDARADAEVETMAQAAVRDLRPRTCAVQAAGGPLRLFVEVLHPPPRLVVCGAGHDAIPVVRLASLLGWRVLVVDRREAFLTPERFPEAAGFVHTEFEGAGKAVPTDAHTYVLIMTHNYLHDRDLLRSFLPTAATYLGMLGPRARTEKIVRELEAEGVVVDERRRAQIFGPVGLDIGSETPDEIALAALAEILAAARGRAGGFLRARAGPIHASLPDAQDTPAPRARAARSDGTSVA